MCCHSNAITSMQRRLQHTATRFQDQNQTHSVHETFFERAQGPQNVRSSFRKPTFCFSRSAALPFLRIRIVIKRKYKQAMSKNACLYAYRKAASSLSRARSDSARVTATPRNFSFPGHAATPSVSRQRPNKRAPLRQLLHLR